MNLNPKKRFLEDKDRTNQHADIAVKPLVQDTLMIALAQMTVELPASSDFQMATRSRLMLEGAQMFIHVWLNLSTATRPLPKIPSDQLNET